MDLDVRSVYLYGRYRKLERGVPQTRWPCRACKGRGCDRCEGTGLQYATSVQQLVADPLREMLGAEDDAFHGMGREDIDVRCLGRGRPFVVELKSPMRRSVDAAAAMDAINEAAAGAVEVTSFAPPAAKRWSASRTPRPRNPTRFASALPPCPKRTRQTRRSDGPDQRGRPRTRWTKAERPTKATWRPWRTSDQADP